MESFFQISNSACLSVCTSIFKRIVRLCFYLKCLILWLYINGSILTSSTNKWKSFFKFVFELMAEKSKNIETNSEAWVLIKVQCVIYQWIRLDKLYKLMERFFSNLEFVFVFELLTENPKIFNNKQGWVYVSEVGEAFVLISTRSSSSSVFHDERI